MSKPVFLHSFWRSSSTYFWAKFRADSRFLCFYEPFHESLATLSEEHMRLGVTDWHSHHPALELPYFHEYKPLMRPEGGAAGYADTLAIDDYFTDDSGFERSRAWVQQLIDLARSGKRQPVLGFCRSMGRVNSLLRAFPDAVNIVIVRDPLPTFKSNWSQFTQYGNPYFVSMYGLIVASHPEIELFDRLRAGLGLPDMRRRMSVEQKGRLLAARIREWGAFTCLMLFLTVFFRALSRINLDDCLVLHVDRMTEPDYRRRKEREIFEATGFRIDMSDCAAPDHSGTDLNVNLWSAGKETAKNFPELAGIEDPDFATRFLLAQHELRRGWLSAQ